MTSIFSGTADGGRRPLVDEKQIVKDVASLLHLTKAQNREKKQAGKVAKAKGAAATKSTQAQNAKQTTSESPKKGAQKKDASKGPKAKSDASKKKAAAKATPEMKKQHKKRQNKQKRRRCTGGNGTIWVTLTGGFHSLAQDDADVREHNAVFRGIQNEKRRLQVLKQAEDYVESAWNQAVEAGLAEAATRKPASAEGESYLTEQYAVAHQMILAARQRPIGSWSANLLAQTSAKPPAPQPQQQHGSTTWIVPTSSVATTVAPPPPASVEKSKKKKSASFPLTRDAFADLIVRENLILNAFVKKGTQRQSMNEASVGTEEEDVLRSAEAAQKNLFFTLNEPLTSTVEELAKLMASEVKPGSKQPAAAAAKSQSESVPLPTKCVVRVRNNGKRKATTVLSTAKQVNYFKSNFMQNVRREISF